MTPQQPLEPSPSQPTEQKVLSQKVKEQKELVQQREQAYKIFSGIAKELQLLKQAISGAQTKQRSLRDARDRLNNECRSLIQQAKAMQEEKKKLSLKGGVGDHDKILVAITKFELKVETEALSLDQEKKIMKKIGELKKKYGASEHLRLLYARSHDISKKIDTTRREADKRHTQLKESLQQYKENIEQFMKLSKEASALQNQGQQLRQQISTTRKDTKSLASAFYQNKKRTYDKTRQERELTHYDREQRMNHLIEERVQEVEEKIKQGKKLTTRDILSFQGKK